MYCTSHILHRSVSWQTMHKDCFTWHLEVNPHGPPCNSAHMYQNCHCQDRGGPKSPVDSDVVDGCWTEEDEAGGAVALALEDTPVLSRDRATPAPPPHPGITAQTQPRATA